MKIKNTLTTLSTIIALTMMAMSAFSQNNTFSAPQNMSATLNSSVNDTNATISPNGLSFYFTSNRTGSLGSTDIYVSQRATLNSAWGAPQNLGATVNTSSGDSIGSLSLDGRTMFLQSTRPGGFGLRDNYISTRSNPNNDFGWTTPVNLGAVVNTALDELAATYFEDPTTGINSIIFGSDRVGIPGRNYHFYQSTRNADGTFNPPSPISELNSDDSAELRMAIRRDGLECFISSVRDGGLVLGVFDIWVSTRASTTSLWNPPILAAGVNSLEDDSGPSLSPDGSILYFNATRAGGVGAADLYSAIRCSLYVASPCSVNFGDTGQTDDISVFRPSTDDWRILKSSNGQRHDAAIQREQ